MLKKLAVVGAVAAAIVGVGTASLAVTGDSGSPVPSSAQSSALQDPGRGRPDVQKLAKRALHGQFVTRGTGSTFVTHDVIRGEVSAVSSTSIAVKAADGFSQQFVVTADTKVRIRADGKGAAGKIADVRTGDKVLVVGTGTGPFTATYLIVAR